MADQKPPTKAGILLHAVNTARGPGSRITTDAGRPPTLSVTTKAGARPITFAKPSNALRQHVAATQGAPMASRLETIHLRSPGDPPAHTQEVERPSPGLRNLVGAQEGLQRLQREDLHGSTVIIAKPHDLGRQVRSLRERAGLNQTELAGRALVGRRFVSELEAGKYTLEFGKVLAVCRVLGLSLMSGPAGE